MKATYYRTMERSSCHPVIVDSAHGGIHLFYISRYGGISLIGRAPSGPLRSCSPPEKRCRQPTCPNFPHSTCWKPTPSYHPIWEESTRASSNETSLRWETSSRALPVNRHDVGALGECLWNTLPARMASYAQNGGVSRWRIQHQVCPHRETVRAISPSTWPIRKLRLVHGW